MFSALTFCTMTLRITTFNITKRSIKGLLATLNIDDIQHKCHTVSSAIMLSVVMLRLVMPSVVMLSVVMLSVVMLNVVAPKRRLPDKTETSAADPSVCRR